MKHIIIDYLKILSDEKKITMYGFVIMPNHLHFIWQQNMLNGKELPKGSFMKYTALLPWFVPHEPQSHDLKISNHP
ncbi:MAG: hypothetical protein ABI402_07935 [Ferruginibacter sp.]